MVSRYEGNQELKPPSGGAIIVGWTGSATPVMIYLDRKVSSVMGAMFVT